MEKRQDSKQGYVHIESQKTLERKIQKIITALYLVTDILPEQEPVRTMLRLHAVEVSNLVQTLKIETPSQAQKTITEIEMYIGQLVGLLETSVSVGFVSDMNYKLLRESLVFIQDELEKRFGILSQESYQTALLYNQPVNSVILPEDVLAELSGNGERNVPKGQTPDIEKGQTHKQKDIENTLKKTDTQKTEPSTELQSREVQLLDVVRQKGVVSVADITPHFPEISEKTIQRMLLRLTSLGHLSKEGEKRWSRYSLTQS